jgi:hypothetical protein
MLQVVVTAAKAPVTVVVVQVAILVTGVMVVQLLLVPAVLAAVERVTKAVAE